MKTIIAGSRDCNDYNILEKAISECGWKPSTVISGTARGADKLGELWAVKNDIQVIRFPANWEKFGKKAGFLRNQEMAKVADALIALWDLKSSGTKHMIDTAKKHRLLIYVSYFV